MSGQTPTALELRERVERHPWYHTLELGDGVVTKGMFDHRPVVGRYPIPDDLTGMRCLDVATMDGFWAFEMERRGATSVTALDVADPSELDWPASLRGRHDTTLDAAKGERFEIARSALGSRVERVILSAYELRRDGVGTFDFVFCGDLLLHLKDPVTALENIRDVCTGSAVIASVITRFGSQDRRAIAELDGIDDFTWWVPNMAGLVRLAGAAGFARVEEVEPFELRFTSGEPGGLRGAIRAYA